MFNGADQVGSNGNAMRATTFEQSDLPLNTGNGGCMVNVSQWWSSSSNTMNNMNSHQEQKAESLETLMARTYNEIPHEERGEQLNELHGVSDEIIETPEMIGEGLRQLDVELGRIADKPAYDLALSLSPEYVLNRKFRLMFLRAGIFDARASAKRMVFHFEQKLELFGRDLLTKDILLSDLEDHEIEYFRAGRQQPLMQRDRSGRMISFVTRQQQTENVPIMTRMRVTFYYMMALINGDDLTQKRGIVVVWWVIKSDTTFTYGQGKLRRIASLSRSLPSRNSAIHLCSNDNAVRPVVNLGARLMETKLRIRFRLHFGSAQECIYALMTYGISREIIPIDSNNILSTTFFNSWLAMREEKEKGMLVARNNAKGSNVVSNSAITVPGQYDVLMGRGKVIESSPGNNHLRYLISVYFEKYDQAARCEKNVVCLWILEMIEKKGGKFLKKEGQKGWERIPEQKAIDKISHDFRNYRIRGAAGGAFSGSHQSARQTSAVKRPMNWHY